MGRPPLLRQCLPAILAIAVLGSTAEAAQGAPRPNIIVVQTDDQDAASLRRSVMPQTTKLMRRGSTRFTDYVASGPVCCPSRAVLLTGQYGHNNGVLWQNPNPYGLLRGKHNTLPVWLRRAGYRTAHVGKYLNLYARAVEDPNEVAPGWDEWHTALEPIRYYDYVLRENGRAVQYGSRPRDYLTRVLNRKAVDLVHRYVPRRRPLFMELDHYAPHGSPVTTVPTCAGSAVPGPKDEELFAGKRLPQGVSFNEPDVSDKPSYVRARPRLRPGQIAYQRRLHRCRLAALRAVDRGIREIVAALRSEHELDDTAIVFISDNGWLQGEHRIPGRKVAPYEESLHVPFVLRLPREMRPSKGAPRKLSTTVANVDVAPTLLRLAKAEPCPRKGPCRILDGRSMLKAVRSGGSRWPRRRGVLLELESTSGKAGPYTPCDYEGIRTSTHVYVEYHAVTLDRRGPCIAREEAEHYDLRSDPFQLDNLFPAPEGSDAAAKERSLARRLARLRDCAGVEGRDPRPASGHHCE